MSVYPTQKQLIELFDYNSDTGDLVRRQTRSSRAMAGCVAGCYCDKDYVRISINRKLFLAHRLVWIYVYGYNPENFIDHINGNKQDNRVVNLREVTNQCNMRNYGAPKNNKSGIKGVCYDSSRGLWLSQIGINRRTYSLGRYSDFDEAVCYRLAAEQCLDWNGCDSSSQAYIYVQDLVRRQNVVRTKCSKCGNGVFREEPICFVCVICSKHIFKDRPSSKDKLDQYRVDAQYSNSDGWLRIVDTYEEE